MEETKAGILSALLEEKEAEIHELQALIQSQGLVYQREIDKIRDFHENILALMPGNVYWLDRANTYLGCNDIQARLAGLLSRRDIVGKRNVDLPWKNQADELDKVNLRVMETGIADSKIEEAVMLNGEGIYFSQKVPLKDEHNEVVGLVGISIDITELKKTEEALTLAKEIAEAANLAKIEFIANMSHDIRTPLSGVVGLSKLLEEQLTHPDHKQYAQWINQSGEQLLSLLNGILEVISVENSRALGVREDIFDLRQCVDDIVQLERPTTALKQLDLVVKIDERAPRYIVCDRASLHRVLLNLLGNAVKFTQAGSVTIEVTWIEDSLQHVHLQFRVMDTGIGIPKEDQNKIFDRFFRGSSSYEGIYAGYGVGLHIAQSYVGLLGGELQVLSDEGVGSTFYFDLSVRVPTHELLAHHGFLSSDTPERVGNVKPHTEASYSAHIFDTLSHQTDLIPHVLLVEDNMIALRMLELIMTQAGCRFTSAVSGEYALDLLKNTAFDLIVTDVGLPGISGYELTRRIREGVGAGHSAVIPIIGITAHGQSHVKNQCLESGMNDVFCKPVNLELIQSIITRYIGGPRRSNLPKSSRTARYDLPEMEYQLFDLDKYLLLDIEHSAQRLGSETLLRDMLQLMVQQEIPKDIEAIQLAHAKNDWDAVEKIAHKIKGGAVYCGTFRMQHACQYLERYRQAGYSVALEALYQQLLQVLEDTQQAIWCVL